MSLKKASFIIVFILLIDQISKFYIKTHFVLGEDVKVFDWFKILFVENRGMAWGAQIPGEYGKVILTTFRLIAIFAIGYWQGADTQGVLFVRHFDLESSVLRYTPFINL